MKNKNSIYLKSLKFYKKNGYLKISLFSKKEIKNFKNIIAKDLNTKLRNKLKSKVKIENLEKYHDLRIVENEHKFLVKPGHRYFKFNKKTVKKILNKQVLFLLKSAWGHTNISLNWIGDLKKKQKLVNATGYRLARPFENHNNDTAGAHIDMNVGGIINKDKNASATIWIPIVGFSKKYTLKISPRSHNYNHGNKFKKSKKVSPLLPGSYWKKFKFIRLAYKTGQAMIFHPNLLHGGSDNHGSVTRVSLDTRILNLKRFNY